ncbi:hypothetical protein P7F88_05065 [Vibrio hannami]|uniref:hypothetical protein n=1 Tax=Vibrio hannami TaxID=2717094 RepID=UPI0024104387|nr:hypothetical protein [Vibrio hannami]MDG3085504.1 hypothetical protein [Vibrio hannami]
MSEKLFQPNTQLTVDDLELAYHAVKGGRFIGKRHTISQIWHIVEYIKQQRNQEKASS